MWQEMSMASGKHALELCILINYYFGQGADLDLERVLEIPHSTPTQLIKVSFYPTRHLVRSCFPIKFGFGEWQACFKVMHFNKLLIWVECRERFRNLILDTDSTYTSQLLPKPNLTPGQIRFPPIKIGSGKWQARFKVMPFSKLLIWVRCEADFRNLTPNLT